LEGEIKTGSKIMPGIVQKFDQKLPNLEVIVAKHGMTQKNLVIIVTILIK
jgi:hypothetical protein